MLAVKNTGGVVGIMGYGPYLRGPCQELRMQPPEENIAHAAVDDFVIHVAYVLNLIGIDHVGLCTDGYLDGTMAFSTVPGAGRKSLVVCIRRDTVKRICRN